MVFITNWQLVEKFQDQDLQALLETFDVIWVLFKKYWKKLLLTNIFSAIEKIDANVAWFIKLLNNLWKLNSQDLNSLTKLLKSKCTTYTHEFTLKSWSNKVYNEVNNYVSNKFENFEINLSHADDVGIAFSWEWFYYKRSLDNDLDKLVK